MKYLFFLLSSSICFSAGIEDIIFKDYNDVNKKYNTTHWVFHSEMAFMTYKSENSLPNDIKKDKLESDDSKLYWGPSLGLGRRFFLSSRLSLSAHLDAYYMLNNKTDDQIYSREFERSVLYNKDSNTIYGARTFAALYFRTPFRRFFIEPFISGGIGYSIVKNKVDYTYDDLVNIESYKATINEKFSHLFYGLGVNVLSTSGLSVYLKAHKNLLTIGNSTKSTRQIPYSSSTTPGQASESSSDLNIDKNRDEYTISLGFGYIF